MNEEIEPIHIGEKEDIDINEVKLTLVKNFELVFDAEINFEAN